jgi:hypothetical protein
MKYEHVNTAKEIEEVLEYFFEDVECSIFGITKYMSLYHFYACHGPRLEACREFIKS